MVVADHLLHVDGGLHAVVHRRVGEDGLVVEQVALSVETHHLAARAEAWVDAHHALLAQRCREQQLAQVLGEDADGLVVGLLLAQVRELRLDRGLQQSLVTVLDGFFQQLSAGLCALERGQASLQALHTLLVVGTDADAQNALSLAPAHGQQTVARAASQRFVPVEVVAELLGFVSILFGLHHLRRDDSLAAECAAHSLTVALVLAHLFGNDVLRTLQGRLCVLDVDLDEPLSSPLGVALALHQQQLGQRFESLFAGHLGTCAALRAVGQVDVLERGRLPRLVDALLELGRELLLVADGLEDGLLALLNLLQALILVADGPYLHFVESARALLAVAGNEGNGAALVEQGECAVNVFGSYVKPFGYEVGENIHTF